ncbi:MAG: hypothetical protein ABSB13_04585 [Candidatus Binatus sp.]|jgi:hypothetical protein
MSSDRCPRLVKQGFDVYMIDRILMIDWILPRPDDKRRGFDAYD